MIVKYDEFLSKIPGEVTEVEVDDELGKHITEMDEVAAKIDRKETRRHIYMSVLEEKGRYIPDDSDPLDDVLKEERIKELMAAIEKLKPQQKDIAAEEGVSPQAIASRLKTILKKLKKFLK